MPVRAERVRYGDQVGYFAVGEQAATPLPAVIVIQEICGVNDHIEDVTRRIAAAGYAALAPDSLPSRASGPRLSPRAGGATWPRPSCPRCLPAEPMDPAVRDAEMARLPEPERSPHQGDLRADVRLRVARPPAGHGARASQGGALPQVRAPETKGQPVGCVGFCMGGGLSALLACEEPELSAAAIYYGSTPPAEKIAEHPPAR